MCASSITVLPTDPAGGTPITLADNANSNITLSGGAQVSLYGVNYSNFFVGSNGYITFNTGDTDSTPSIADHFNRPRISAIFSNLNPAIGGTVSWKQLADRAVVTFQNVPLASTTNSNTFQYELFFDGRIRISYLQIDVTTGISGLSGGGGIPPDFFEMNLSGAASCGPQPPAAASRTHETPINIPLDITLIAGDDGIPGPLSYIITSLPAAPLEDLGNSHTIQPGDLPYTLAGGGNQVRYHSGPTPTTDSFQFKVNDGGTPPTGGDSNTATVTINVQPVLALPFFDDFPTTTFDSQKWYLVDTVTIDDVGIAEPSAPYSARFNGMPDGSDELQSHLINLSGQTAVRLSYWFQCRGGGESPDAGEDLVVEFRNDVGNWQEIQRHLGTLPDMTTYQQVSILLPSSAFHPAFRLRFRNTGTSSATTPFDDWFVDDVSINVANAPTADNMAVTAPFNGFLDIALSASDPNLDPLNFTILSLPASGTLKDPGAGLTEITTVPYTLAGGGNVVRYTPPPAFGGVVQFNFKANDGTYDSNTATVTVTVEPVLNLPFFDDFPTTTFDSGKWGFVSGATIDTLGIAEPSEPNSLRMNGNPSGADEVYTFAIDLSVHTAVRLSYYYQLRGGGGSPEAGDDLVVFYRDSVGNWQEIQRHLGSGADMTTYQQVVIDLPPQARHAGFRLRFRSTGGTGATDDDWFVDDVSIISLNNPVAQNASLTTAVNTVGSTLLPANDPNGDTLTWVIQSLPTNGLLKDPNGGIITTVPYSLLSNANSILYKPAFNYQGSDSFTFKATDGVYDSGTASVSVTVGGAAVIHFFPLDTDPGWSCDPGAGGGGPNNGGWAFGTPTNSDPPCGTGRLDPPGGFTGANVYGYNLAGCYTGLLSPTRWLTTTPLDCSNATAVQLRFRRWLGVESGAFDHAYIQVSTNGSTWTPVWDHTGVTIAEQAWSQQTYSLPTADNQPTVYIRWGMGTTDASVHYQGWNIDDIEILGLVPQTCDAVLPGDLNGDGLRNGDDIQGMVTVTIDPFLATAAQTCAADVNEDNAIDAADPPALVQLLLTTP
jgi:hypothetical protein